jgi:hypothetical protein
LRDIYIEREREGYSGRASTTRKDILGVQAQPVILLLVQFCDIYIYIYIHNLLLPYYPAIRRCAFDGPITSKFFTILNLLYIVDRSSWFRFESMVPARFENVNETERVPGPYGVGIGVQVFLRQRVHSRISLFVHPKPHSENVAR